MKSLPSCDMIYRLRVVGPLWWFSSQWQWCLVAYSEFVTWGIPWPWPWPWTFDAASYHTSPPLCNWQRAGLAIRRSCFEFGVKSLKLGDFVPSLYSWYFHAPGRMIGGILFLSCLFVVNFNLRYNFWALRHRDFIFGIHMPLMMLFQMTPRSMNLWPWPLC